MPNSSPLPTPIRNSIRPPTPPRHAIEDLEDGLKAASQLLADFEASTSPIKSQVDRLSQTDTPPKSPSPLVSTPQEALAIAIARQVRFGRDIIHLSPGPETINPPHSVLRPLPPSRTNSSDLVRPILKRSLLPLQYLPPTTDSPVKVRPLAKKHFRNMAEVMSHVVSQIARPEPSSRLDGYFTLERQMNVFEAPPDLDLVAQHISIIVKQLRRDILIDELEPHLASSDLHKSAVKLLTILITIPEVRENIKDESMVDIIARSVKMLEDSTTPEDTAACHLLLLSKQKLGALTDAQVRKLLDIVAKPVVLKKDAGFKRNRAALYRNLADTLPNLFANLSALWIPRLFHDVQMRNQDAIDALGGISQRISLHRTPAKSLQSYLERPDPQRRTTKGHELLQLLELMMAGPQAGLAMGVWIAVMFMCQSTLKSPQGWILKNHDKWLSLLDNCLVSSMPSARQTACLTFNQVVHLIKPDQTTRPEFAAFLCRPFERLLQASHEQIVSQNGSMNLTATGPVLAVLYASFHPVVKDEDITWAWNFWIAERLVPLASKSSAHAELVDNILAQLFDGKKQWVEGCLTLDWTLKPEDLSCIRPAWVLANFRIVMQAIEPVIIKVAQLSHEDQSRKSSHLLENVLSTVQIARSNEITPSENTKRMVSRIATFLFQLCRTLYDPAVKGGINALAVRNTALQAQKSLQDMGFLQASFRVKYERELVWLHGNRDNAFADDSLSRLLLQDLFERYTPGDARVRDRSHEMLADIIEWLCDWMAWTPVTGAVDDATPPQVRKTFLKLLDFVDEIGCEHELARRILAALLETASHFPVSSTELGMIRARFNKMMKSLKHGEDLSEVDQNELNGTPEDGQAHLGLSKQNVVTSTAKPDVQSAPTPMDIDEVVQTPRETEQSAMLKQARPLSPNEAASEAVLATTEDSLDLSLLSTDTSRQIITAAGSNSETNLQQDDATTTITGTMPPNPQSHAMSPNEDRIVSFFPRSDKTSTPSKALTTNTNMRLTASTSPISSRRPGLSSIAQGMKKLKEDRAQRSRIPAPKSASSVASDSSDDSDSSDSDSDEDDRVVDGPEQQDAVEAIEKKSTRIEGSADPTTEQLGMTQESDMEVTVPQAMDSIARLDPRTTLLAPKSKSNDSSASLPTAADAASDTESTTAASVKTAATKTPVNIDIEMQDATASPEPASQASQQKTKRKRMTQLEKLRADEGVAVLPQGRRARSSIGGATDAASFTSDMSSPRRRDTQLSQEILRQARTLTPDESPSISKTSLRSAASKGKIVRSQDDWAEITRQAEVDAKASVDGDSQSQSRVTRRRGRPSNASMLEIDDVQSATPASKTKQHEAEEELPIDTRNSVRSRRARMPIVEDPAREVIAVESTETPVKSRSRKTDAIAAVADEVTAPKPTQQAATTPATPSSRRTRQSDKHVVETTPVVAIPAPQLTDLTSTQRRSGRGSTSVDALLLSQSQPDKIVPASTVDDQQDASVTTMAPAHMNVTPRTASTKAASAIKQQYTSPFGNRPASQSPREELSPTVSRTGRLTTRRPIPASSPTMRPIGTTSTVEQELRLDPTSPSNLISPSRSTPNPTLSTTSDNPPSKKRKRDSTTSSAPSLDSNTPSLTTADHHSMPPPSQRPRLTLTHQPRPLTSINTTADAADEYYTSLWTTINTAFRSLTGAIDTMTRLRPAMEESGQGRNILNRIRSVVPGEIVRLSGKLSPFLAGGGGEEGERMQDGEGMEE